MKQVALFELNSRKSAVIVFKYFRPFGSHRYSTRLFFVVMSTVFERQYIPVVMLGMIRGDKTSNSYVRLFQTLCARHTTNNLHTHKRQPTNNAHNIVLYFGLRNSQLQLLLHFTNYLIRAILFIICMVFVNIHLCICIEFKAQPKLVCWERKLFHIFVVILPCVYTIHYMYACDKSLWQFKYSTGFRKYINDHK